MQDFWNIVGSIALWLTWISLYCTPTIIAALRSHKQLPALAIVNFFLACTVIGWIGCFAWAFQNQEGAAR